MVQISISTTEKRDIEGTEQKQEINPKKTKKKKKIAPAAESKEEMVHKEFLLIKPQFPVDPLLQMWNATHFTDTIFTIVKYEEIN